MLWGQKNQIVPCTPKYQLDDYKEKNYIGGLFNMYMKLLSYSLSLNHDIYKIIPKIATLARTPVAIKTPLSFLLPQIQDFRHQFKQIMSTLSHIKYISLVSHYLNLVCRFTFDKIGNNKREGPYYLPLLLGQGLLCLWKCFLSNITPSLIQMVIIDYLPSFGHL